MRLNMMSGGEVVDYDALTAKPEEVLEGEFFMGIGSEDAQIGTMANREKMYGAPGISEETPEIPVHEATLATVATVTDGSIKIALSPPEGKYPGRERAFVGCNPRQLDILEENIANRKIVAGVVGTYGADGDLTGKDLRAGRVGYGSNGRVIGEAEDHGTILKTIEAGSSYDIKPGFYEGGKVTAKDIKTQTKGTATSGDLSWGKTAWVNGEKILGSLMRIQAIDEAKQTRLIYDKLYVGMSPGIHEALAASGYPEVCVEQNDLAVAIGLTEDKLAPGETLLGKTGNYRSRLKTLSAIAIRGFGALSQDQIPEERDSFILTKAGTVVYSGLSASYLASGETKCEIYKNGVLVDSQNINAANNYNWRISMRGKYFAAQAGDKIEIVARALSGADTFSAIYATIVY